MLALMLYGFAVMIVHWYFNTIELPQRTSQNLTFLIDLADRRSDIVIIAY